ncbi:unnamed protein product [Closterium sp. NIES-65]|nr:unnamed protein product [Closterium sp. NIES-65]
MTQLSQLRTWRRRPTPAALSVITLIGWLFPFATRSVASVRLSPILSRTEACTHRICSCGTSPAFRPPNPPFAAPGPQTTPRTTVPSGRLAQPRTAAHVELVKRTRRSKILAWFTAPPPHPYDRAIRFRTFEWLEGCGGYGDALNGLLFAFVTALLDGRALIVRHDCLPAAFLSAMIDCQLSDDVPLDPATVVPPLDYYGDGVVAARPPPAKAGEVVRLDLRNKRVELEIYFKELENATNIRVAANRGMLTHLATKAEGAWADRFKAMGIRAAHTLWGAFTGSYCGERWAPCDEVKELFHSTMQNLEAQKAPGSNSSSISSHVATLGIHIRVQDDVVWAGDRGAPKELSMQDVEALVGNAKQWLDCAAVRDWGGEGWAA